MRTGIAVLHGERRKVSFQLVTPAATGVDVSGVLVIDHPDFFSPGDVFLLETERGAPRALVVDKIRPESEDALVAFSTADQGD